jgi:hypothetical protein
MEQILHDILRIAEKSQVEFKLGEITAPALSAMRSPQVSLPMMHLSTIVMNSASPGLLDKIEITAGQYLLPIVFDYALEVAPRVEGSDITIDVSALQDHTEFMKKELGEVEISPELITRIGQYAQMRINLQELENRQQPERSDDQEH